MDRVTQSRRPRFDPNSTTQERQSAEIEHDSGAGHAKRTSDRAPGSITGVRDGRLAVAIAPPTESTEEPATFPPVPTQCPVLTKPAVRFGFLEPFLQRAREDSNL
jgi:hypothetical protein